MTSTITTDTQEIRVCKSFGLTWITHCGIPSVHLRKQSKRELCSFDQKYKQKNKPIFNAVLKFPCGAHKKPYVQ